MPVKLRLRRLGRTHNPFYHIVAADSRSPRDGKFIEKIGSYDVVANPAKVSIDHALALKWLKDGAQPTETVRALLSHEGILLKLHLHRKGKDEAQIEQEFAIWSNSKQGKVAAVANKIQDARKADYDARMANERQKRQQRTDKQAAKLAAADAAAAPAAPAAEAEAAPAEA